MVRVQNFWALLRSPFGPLSKKYGAPGGALGRPEVASEALKAILKMLKKRWFLYCFEPLGLSSGAQGSEKGSKRGDLGVSHKQTPAVKSKKISMTIDLKARRRP